VLYHGKKTTQACFFACESEAFSYEQTLIPVAGDRLEVAKEGLSILGSDVEWSQGGADIDSLEARLRDEEDRYLKFVLEPLRHNERTIRLVWKQRNTDAYFDADSLSDGTLRFMSLTTLLNQPRWSMPTLIVIDELELGLHPLAIRLLAEMLDAASEHTQVLVATQSVTLLDNFPIEQVVVADHDGKGSVFRRLKADDYRLWLENFSVGELWEKNVLGGRP
jgi:hypothetical protein